MTKAARAPILLIVALALGCEVPSAQRVSSPADMDAREVPVSFSGPNDAALIVPVHINGMGPFDFVLDTGATMTCLSHGTAERLGTEATPGASGIGAGIGGAGRVEMVALDSLRVGETQVAGMLGCLLDLSQFRALGAPIDGLLGLNFLREFRVTLDFGRNTLRLDPL
jgi:predicted aspartyl protease